MQTAKIVRFFNHGTNVQLLCEDERGLLSVYFKHKPFGRLFRALHKAGLKLNGLPIKFNRDIIRVPALGKRSDYSPR
jgi:hypothetical protein